MTPFEQEMVRQGLDNLWIQFFIAIGAFLVAALAIWGDTLKNHFFEPKLEVSVQLEPPYCQRLPLGTWFRLKVENVSRTAAQNVEPWIVELRRGSKGNSIQHNLVPIPLKWTHTEKSVAASINPSFHRYCDFGALNRTYGELTPFTENPEAMKFHLLTDPELSDSSAQLGASAYYVRLSVTASNSKSRYFYFCFEVPHYFPPTEEEALKAVNLRSVKSWNT
jgi:hypothetical protein